ncbi:MAG: hypothetical protein ACXVAY_20330 [Mucilaginibacter sp.]
MKKAILLVLTASIFSSFYNTPPTLKGTWEFRGGIYNGKIDGAPKDYRLQRRYTATLYDAYVLEKGAKTTKYESGKYSLKGDTCLETQTYCSQPSKLIGVTVHYLYKFRHDTLILQAKLPNGNIEEDYWKKVK